MSFTEEQVNEIFKDVELIFWSYYKHSFTFFAAHSPEIGDPGYEITVSTGGHADDIYKFSVNRYKKLPFKFVKHWNSVVVKGVSKGGATWEEFTYFRSL